MSVQGLLEGVLKEVHEELFNLMHRLPSDEAGTKALQESVLLCDSLLSEYARYAQMIDPSPRAAEFWRQNLPQKEREKFYQCDQWVKLLKKGYLV